jgi:hypothetical protein
MRIKSFTAFFCLSQIIFIFLLIEKEGRFVRTSFEKQRLEKKRHELIDLQDNLTQQLYALQSRSSIKQFALEKLAMQQLSLSSVITSTHYE